MRAARAVCEWADAVGVTLTLGKYGVLLFVGTAKAATERVGRDRSESITTTRITSSTPVMTVKTTTRFLTILYLICPALIMQVYHRVAA